MFNVLLVGVAVFGVPICGVVAEQRSAVALLRGRRLGEIRRQQSQLSQQAEIIARRVVVHELAVAQLVDVDVTVPTTYVARMRDAGPIPESEWVEVDRDAALPFWSPDGGLVYYVTGTTVGGQVIRARRFDPAVGRLIGERFDVYALEGMVVPAFLTSGAALLATANEIVMTLADFHGDVWVTSLPAER